MSRLDGFINRMVSQRACIDNAVSATAGMTGPIFELGLGNGRTYHHMVENFPNHDVYVFERAVAAHPKSIPPDDRLFLGDITETLPAAVERFGPAAVLINADIGNHDTERNDALARMISPMVEALLAKGGLVTSTNEMYFDKLEEKPAPPNCVVGRCFTYGYPD